MIEITAFRNSPVNSNCFVVQSTNTNKCIIIDPGSEDSSIIINFITNKDLTPDYIVLTHEHFDHIWGINHLKKEYPIQVICSIECAKNIADPKKNMSIFYDQVGFNVQPADIILKESHNCFFWNNTELNFFSTPGHTKGSICLYFKNYLFTGDTLIKGLKTVTKLPGGSITELNKSLNFISKTFKLSNPMVYPGHNDCFFLNDYRFF